MRISKELFNKLSKKNQLEFKSKIDKSREIKPPRIWMTYIYWFIYFFSFMMIVMPLWKLAFGYEILRSLGIITLFVAKVFVFLISLGILIDSIVLMVRVTKIDKVKREYFKIEVRDEKAN